MRVVIHGVPNSSGPIVFENVDALVLGARVQGSAPIIVSGSGFEIAELSGLILRDLRQSMGEKAFAHALQCARVDRAGVDVSDAVLRGGR